MAGVRSDHPDHYAREDNKMATDQDEWTYDAYRVGRATRTVEVDAMDGTHTIEEGTLRFEEINEEDGWMWEEEDWVDHYVDPDGDGLGAHVPREKVGIIEFPHPMTEEEAWEWLQNNPEKWREFRDETLECDVTADDILEEIR